MRAQIEQLLPSLTDAEARVGQWVLAHPRQTLDASVRELATAADCSDPTVIRFCRRLGLTGYRELKLRLAEDLSRPARHVHRDVTAVDSVADAVSKVLDSSLAALLELRANAARLPFTAAAKALAEAGQILFLGQGASGRVAADASHKFFRLGVPCSYASDAPTIRQRAAVSRARDVLILVSHRGDPGALVDAATLARVKGATIVAVSRVGSPLLDEADIPFALSADEDTGEYTPMSSRLVHLAVLDALHVALALELGPDAIAALRQAKQALATPARHGTV